VTVPTPPVALSIAGSDSAAGAGAQADLKTFSALGVFATTAITAVTAQNTLGVRAVHVVPTPMVEAQVDAVLDDLAVRSVKTGMLATLETLAAVGALAARGRLANLVVDPVMVASTGDRLLAGGAEAAYRELLLPFAYVVTPNVAEAALLVGAQLRNLDDMRAAARELHRTGVRWVVVKGGHLAGDQSADVVYDGVSMTVLSAPRVATTNVHGTGCTLSAAIAAHLARGLPPPAAIRAAKDYVTTALCGAAGWRLGGGSGPLDHMGWAGQVPAS